MRPPPASPADTADTLEAASPASASDPAPDTEAIVGRLLGYRLRTPWLVNPVRVHLLEAVIKGR